jgi:hypothetical protein
VGGRGGVVCACLAEDPEAAACDAAHPALMHPQMLVALEDEVRAGHPLEQRDRFLADLGASGSASAMSGFDGLAEGACGVAHAFTHRPPIVDGGLHIRQSGVQQRHERLADLRIEQRVDLVQLPGFLTAGGCRVCGHRALQSSPTVALDLHHRMDERVHADAGASERETDRIDEERSVVGDDQHLTDWALAGWCGLWCQHFDERFAATPALRQRDMSGGQCERLERGASCQVFLVDTDEVAAQQIGARRAPLAACCDDDPVDQ